MDAIQIMTAHIHVAARTADELIEMAKLQSQEMLAKLEATKQARIDRLVRNGMAKLSR